MASERNVVLIVEDDQDIRLSLRDLLEDEGFVPAEAANGQEALDRLREGLRPCLILLDLMMPVMDGYEFRERQLRDPTLPGVPVVVVSANINPERVAALQADTFLQKPLRADKLIDVVERYCQDARNGQT